MINLFIALAIITNQTNDTLIITKNLNSIFKYYEEEGVSHNKVELYSGLSSEEFEPTLKIIQRKFPELQIEYSKFEKNKNVTCSPSNFDLTILFPSSILKEDSGVFEYNFQSRVKNIFGNLKVELAYIEDTVVIENEQFFITSIGD